MRKRLKNNSVTSRTNEKPEQYQLKLTAIEFLTPLISRNRRLTSQVFIVLEFTAFVRRDAISLARVTESSRYAGTTIMETKMVSRDSIVEGIKRGSREGKKTAWKEI